MDVLWPGLAWYYTLSCFASLYWLWYLLLEVRSQLDWNKSAPYLLIVLERRLLTFFIAPLYGCMGYYCKQFIDGINQVEDWYQTVSTITVCCSFQRDHKKMKGFWVIMCLKSTALIFSTSVCFLIYIGFMDEIRNASSDKAQFDKNMNITMMVLLVCLADQLYFNMCINSLLLNTREENYNTLSSSRNNNSNIVVSLQQQTA